ncbi:hypothetical protein [Gulosibacter chungangensis]|uniref:DUF559 domain-containing protein n=1 Tax=Gulosibacter chungangensis TaxID=979746 RepID=A0A7J5BEX2_9MICO|nr:hypothetical protein [Gulosibacter chungangensis]KAB1644784.1 hypothetical protein F8O05_00435 [Gulosibacter chungangensis]
MRDELSLPPQFQSGAFSVSAAVAAGVTPGKLRNPKLHAPFVGVRSHTEPISRRERAIALGQRLSDGQAISGLAAAELWGLRIPNLANTRSADIEVLTRASVSRVRIGGVKSRAIRDDFFRASRLGSVPVVSPVLAVLTSAMHLNAFDITVMLDALLTDFNKYPSLNFAERPLLVPADLPAILAKFERMRGIRTLRQAVVRARPRVESPMESVARLQFVDAGLPEPEVQPEVFLDDGTLYRPDLGYPEAGLYLNYDGDFHFTDQATIDADVLRDRQFQEAGMRLMHVVKTDLNGKRWHELVRSIRVQLARSAVI